MGEIVIDELIRSDRKSVGLSVARDGALTVRAPFRMKRAAVEAVVREKAEWIANKQQEARRRSALHPAPAFHAGERFGYMGRQLVLAYRDGLTAVRREGEVLLVPMETEKEARVLVWRWYKAQARGVFAPRVAACAAAMSLAAPTLRLSSARKRWGSCCSAKRSVNLNWRLVMAPPAVIEYVVVHELAHLTHADHSARFWALVERYCPHWRACRAYLHEHQAILDIE